MPPRWWSLLQEDQHNQGGIVTVRNSHEGKWCVYLIWATSRLKYLHSLHSLHLLKLSTRSLSQGSVADFENVQLIDAARLKEWENVTHEIWWSELNHESSESINVQVLFKYHPCRHPKSLNEKVFGGFSTLDAFQNMVRLHMCRIFWARAFM